MSNQKSMSFRAWLNDKLKDPEFKKAYEENKEQMLNDPEFCRLNSIDPSPESEAE